MEKDEAECCKVEILELYEFAKKSLHRLDRKLFFKSSTRNKSKDGSYLETIETFKVSKELVAVIEFLEKRIEDRNDFYGGQISALRDRVIEATEKRPFFGDVFIFSAFAGAVLSGTLVYTLFTLYK